jgi:hypothetical protein
MSSEDYRRKLADFLKTQPETSGVTYEDIAAAHTREELGIGSLAMILVLVNYIKEFADGAVTVQPEWVTRLNDVEGIVSVLGEIDALHLAQAPA